MSNNRIRNYISQSQVPPQTVSKKKQPRSTITNENDRSKTIVHIVLENRMDKIEDSLPVLLDSYSDAISYVNEDGFLPIHAACRYYARNSKVIEALARSYPIGIRTPVEVCFLHYYFSVFISTSISRIVQNQILKAVGNALDRIQFILHFLTEHLLK